MTGRISWSLCGLTISENFIAAVRPLGGLSGLRVERSWVPGGSHNFISILCCWLDPPVIPRTILARTRDFAVYPLCCIS
jgi:hypothetical protein